MRNTTAPTSSSLEGYRLLLVAAALYDGLLGLLFLLLYRPVFGALGIAVPDNPIYLQLAAGCIALFGLGFWFASQHPIRNLDLVRVGIGLKILFVGLAVYAAARGILPHAVFGLLALIDALFVVALFLVMRGLPMPRD